MLVGNAKLLLDDLFIQGVRVFLALIASLELGAREIEPFLARLCLLERGLADLRIRRWRAAAALLEEHEFFPGLALRLDGRRPHVARHAGELRAEVARQEMENKPAERQRDGDDGQIGGRHCRCSLGM
ncbi:hypothetical protein D3C87_1354490 [compost metagenome]